MALAMTITEAKQLAAGDLEISDEHVGQAQAAADEAEQAAAVLANAAVEGSDTKPGTVVEAEALARFARERAVRQRARADRAKAARRLLDLEQVGKDVEQIHAAAVTPDAGMVAALTAITNGYAALHQLADAHNGKIKDAIGRARELGAEPPAPSGPRASSAHVTVHTGNRKVQSGGAIVQMVDKRDIDDAVAIAIQGDADAAVRRLNAAQRTDPPKRADHYCVGHNGMVHGYSDDAGPKSALPAMVARGELHELTPDEVEAYLDGRYHGYQPQA